LSGRELPIGILNERRRLAVKLRISGMKLDDVAEHAELSVPTVIAAYRAYREGGWDGVAVRPRGRKAGAGRALSPQSEARLLEMMAAGAPTDYGLTGRVWSEAAVTQVIRHKFDIEVGTRTVRRYLERWGLKEDDPAERLRENGGQGTAEPFDRLLAEYGQQPPRKRGRLAWVKTHTIAGPAKGDRHTFLAAQLPRGRCYWVAVSDTPGSENLLGFVEALRAVEDHRPLWAIVRGLDLSRWSERLPEGLVIRSLPTAGTATKLALNTESAGRGEKTPARRKPRKRAAAAATKGLTKQTNEEHPIKRTPPMNDSDYLTHLQRLEAESIHIIREVVAETENPVMLYSIGKDSAVMLHLAMKAFYPSKPPFPLMHVDTRWKFQDMYAFRDKMAEELGMDLIVHINPEGEEKDINPFTHGSAIHTDVMKTEGLKQALDKYGFDAAFGGARRDEEKSRAKERVFSFRTAQHRWDPKNQRPELWKLYNARKHKGESIRVFPLSNWTELDIWQYIHLQDIPLVPLYYSAERPVVERDGALIMVDDERMPLKEGEVPMMKKVRFRTLGCYPLTGAVESEADTLPEIIQEMLLTRSSEREGRVIDHDSAASMEKKKQEGYF